MADLQLAPVSTGGPAGARASNPQEVRERRRFILLVGGLSLLAVVFAGGLLAWDNPMPVGSSGFWTIARLRATTIVILAVVAVCQALATVTFQTVTTNRIVTPSIMGFEALYAAVQTSAVFFLGVAGIVALQGVVQFALQIAIMVGFSLVLYGWLLSGKYANLQVMLLIGIVLGSGLRSVSTFMQRMLTPSEFDVLAARLFGNISNAQPQNLPLAIPIVVVAGAIIWWRARILDVLGLGKDVSVSLGLNHRRELIGSLVLVSVLMAVSTALVGPMTFLGFLIAMLAYQFTDSHHHRRLFPVAVLAGFVVLTGAYLILKHIFYAEGVVSILIEVIGGTVFLVVLLRRGRL